jgi:hypothetical protein
MSTVVKNAKAEQAKTEAKAIVDAKAQADADVKVELSKALAIEAQAIVETKQAIVETKTETKTDAKAENNGWVKSTVDSIKNGSNTLWNGAKNNKGKTLGVLAGGTALGVGGVYVAKNPGVVSDVVSKTLTYVPSMETMKSYVPSYVSSKEALTTVLEKSKSLGLEALDLANNNKVKTGFGVTAFAGLLYAYKQGFLTQEAFKAAWEKMTLANAKALSGQAKDGIVNAYNASTLENARDLANTAKEIIKSGYNNTVESAGNAVTIVKNNPIKTVAFVSTAVALITAYKKNLLTKEAFEAGVAKLMAGYNSLFGKKPKVTGYWEHLAPKKQQ